MPLSQQLKTSGFCSLLGGVGGERCGGVDLAESGSLSFHGAGRCGALAVLPGEAMLAALVRDVGDQGQ